jgi:hypothetical protein
MPTPQVTTLQSVKTFLGIPTDNTTMDAVINALIPAVSVLFKRVTGRVFGSYTYTDYYSGDGSPVLILRQRPVILAGLRVWVDTNGAWGQSTQPFPANSELEAGQFALQLDGDDGDSRSGLLFRVGSVWPMCEARLWQNQSPELAADHIYPSGNVKVLYTAGETDAAIETAGNYAISNILQSKKYSALIQSESYEEYSFNLILPTTKAGIQGMIGTYAWSIISAYKELWF